MLLDRAYRDAPVSPLFYLGRREDLAFEKPAGKSADRRHHVRFWKVLDKGEEQRPVWLGAVTFDKGVGVSHFTGAITHHIDADIDAERDGLVADIEDGRHGDRQISGDRRRPDARPAAMAAAISITPTAKSGFCAWSRTAASRPSPVADTAEPARDRAERSDLACDRRVVAEIGPARA